MNSSNKKELPVPIPVTKTLKPKAQDINIAIICIDTYSIACYLKEAQVFVILIRDIQHQVEKKAKAETNPKSIVFVKYHNFLDVFSNKDSDILPLH